MNVVLRELTLEDVEVELKAEEEEMSPVGYFMNTEEPEKDREMERQILRDLEGGNQWAWCCAVVTVRFGEFKAFATIGGCSYDDDEDFKKGGYYDDMVQEALGDLNKALAKVLEELRPLISVKMP